MIYHRGPSWETMRQAACLEPHGRQKRGRRSGGRCSRRPRALFGPTGGVPCSGSSLPQNRVWNPNGAERYGSICKIPTSRGSDAARVRGLSVHG